jgi:undecaprenyl-diphosphatase
VLSEALPTAPVYALAAAMALSRPYLGVHYPSDVLAGAILGDAIAELLG